MHIDRYGEIVLFPGCGKARLLIGAFSRAFFILLLPFSISLGIITITNMFPDYFEIYAFAFLCTLYGMHAAVVFGKEERSLGKVVLNRGEIRISRAFFDRLRGYRGRIDLCDIDHFLLSNQTKYIHGDFGNHVQRIFTNVKIVTKQGRAYNLGDRKEEFVKDFIQIISSTLEIPIRDRQKLMFEEMDVLSVDQLPVKRTEPWNYIPEILIMFALVMVFPINFIRNGEIMNFGLVVPSLIGLPCLILFLRLRTMSGPRSVHFSADRFFVKYDFGREREIMYRDIKNIHILPSSAVRDNWDFGLVEVSGGLSAFQIGYAPALVLARRLYLV